MEIGEKLYYWRSRKDISIYNLSKISGISEGHIRNLENGKKQPTFKTLETLANALNISLLELLNTDSEAVYLSEGEKKLIELYRSLPKNKADILMIDCQVKCNKINEKIYKVLRGEYESQDVYGDDY